MDPQARDKLDQIMAQIASETGATVHAYPRRRRAVRRVILRDVRDNRGTWLEVAQIEDDGTLRINGHDTGPRVSEFFGTAITSYEWVYLVAPARVDSLSGCSPAPKAATCSMPLLPITSCMAVSSVSYCAARGRRAVRQLAQLSRAHGRPYGRARAHSSVLGAPAPPRRGRLWSTGNRGQCGRPLCRPSTPLT